MTRRAVDWRDIHRRLDLAAAALSGEHERSDAEVRRILEKRARVAAKPPATEDTVERIEVLAFSLAAEHYAVETRHVSEVRSLRELTPLPGTPSFVAGVLGMRGRILAVVDLRMLFELPPRGLGELNRVVVLKNGANEVGLLADSIDGMQALPVAAMQDGLPTLTGVRATYLKGVTGDMLAILDGDRLLREVGVQVIERSTTTPN